MLGSLTKISVMNGWDFLFCIIVAWLIYDILKTLISMIGVNRALKKMQSFSETERTMLISMILSKNIEAEVKQKKKKE
jgi:phosphate/sulfate permease